MKKIVLITFLITALFGQTIDTDNSYVKFKVHNMGIRDVSGTIVDMQGTVIFDSAQLDSAIFDVSVNVNTIDTKSKKRDTHLKNEDFFETGKWPYIHFKSKSIKQNNDRFLMIGDLTIKDVTKEVQVPFNIEGNDQTTTFSGGETVNRLDYNVGVDYSNFKIGYEITVEVVCVVNKD
jgi:polyisoprenoid-binding protein YceI